MTNEPTDAECDAIAYGDGTTCRPIPVIIRAAYAAGAASAAVPRDRIAALAAFADYVALNYPPNTVISDPSWHAPKLFRAAMHAMDAAPARQDQRCPVAENLGTAQCNLPIHHGGQHDFLEPDPTPAPDAVKWVPHVIEEGSRKHVISYHGTVDGAKRVCNVPNCEINRPRKSSDDNSASADRRQQEVFGAGQDAGRPGPNAGGGDAGAIQGADHQRGASVIRERGRPFPLLIDNEVLKAQILADPDDEPTAGNLPDPAPTPAPDAVIEPSKLVAAIKVQLSSAQVALLSGKPERYRGPLVWLNIYGREAVKRIEDLEEQLRDALRDADILADMAQPTSSDPDYLVAELRATHCSNDGLHDKAAAEIVALRGRIAELSGTNMAQRVTRLTQDIAKIGEKLESHTLHRLVCNARHDQPIGGDMCICVPRNIRSLEADNAKLRALLAGDTALKRLESGE